MTDTVYAPYQAAGGYELEPKAFYLPAPLELPYPEGVTAAYAMYYNAAKSTENLIADSEIGAATVEGAPLWYVDRIGAVLSVDAKIQTAVLPTDDVTLYCICHVVKSLNSIGNAVMISSYNGNEDLEPLGDELGFTSGPATLTASIADDVLTVTAHAVRPLAVGAFVEWDDDDGQGQRDTIVEIISGIGEEGEYRLQFMHGTVTSRDMSGRVPQVWALGQRATAGLDFSTMSVAGETEGARAGYAMTASSAGDANTVQVWQYIGGELTGGNIDVGQPRAPVSIDAGPYIIGANNDGAGDDITIEFCIFAEAAHTEAQILANMAYLRQVYLPDNYSVAPTW